VRILFSADWHLKLGQKNVPVTWARSRYKSFFNQLHKLEEEVDLHIIGGDLFDRVPTLEELELYFSYIKECKIETLIYDGNHEATRKNKTFMASLKKVTSSLNSKVSIIDEAYEDVRGFSILPYCDLHKKNSIEMLNPSLPVFTHVRGEIPPHVIPEVDLSRFDKFPTIFAGDLHSHSNCQRNIVYPGSPMTTGFHRTKLETGVMIIVDDFDWIWEQLQLPQLLRKTVNSIEDMVPGHYDHIIYELEGDLGDLAKVSSSQLLDKKVVKRSSEAALLLNRDMSIGEELMEYLIYILEISEEKIPNILGIYNDYIKSLDLE